METIINQPANDRPKVSARQEWEMAHLREKFNVSSQQISDAIKAVGNDRKKMEAYLGNKR